MTRRGFAAAYAVLIVTLYLPAGSGSAQTSTSTNEPKTPPPAATAPPAATSTPAASVPAATSPASSAPTAPVADSQLAPLAWLEGCWRGKVNQREFREHWLPLRGDMMPGASHTVLQDRGTEKTQDYEYLRLEVRADGVYYVVVPSEGQPASFKLAGTTTDGEATIFTFTNVVDTFPQRVIYRRGSIGWLYATVEGQQDGKDRQVIYPMRRISCETGELILK